MQRIELITKKVRSKKQTRIVFKAGNYEITLSGEHVQNRKDAAQMLNNLINDLRRGEYQVFEIDQTQETQTEIEVTSEFLFGVQNPVA